MNYSNLTHLFKVLGIIIFLYLLFILDYEKVFSVIDDISIFFLIPYIISNIIMVLLKSYRWNLVNIFHGINFSTRKYISISFLTISLGNLTPARIGEFGKYIYLKKEGLNFRDSLVNIFSDRFSDIIILFLISLFGSFFLINYFFGISFFLISLVYFTILLLIIPIVFFFKYVLDGLTIFKYIQKIILEIFQCYYENLSKKSIVNLLIFFSILFQLLSLVFLFNVDINIIFLLFIFSISSLLSLLPISIGGLGVREFIFYYFFTILGSDPEIGFMLAFFDGVVFSLLMIPIYFITYYLIKPVDL